MSRLPRLLSMREFHEATGIPLSTCYLIVNRREIRAVRYGGGRGSVRVREEDVRGWIEEHTEVPS